MREVVGEEDNGEVMMDSGSGSSDDGCKEVRGLKEQKSYEDGGAVTCQKYERQIILLAGEQPISFSTNIPSDDYPPGITVSPLLIVSKVSNQ